MQVLQDGPELDPKAGHQSHRPLDRFEPAQGGELIEQEQHRGRWDNGRARQVAHGLGDHQAKPATVGADAIGRQHQEHGRRLFLQRGKVEVGASHDRGHARAVEEMRVALCRGAHAGGLAAILGQVPVGGTGDETAGGGTRLHRDEQPFEAINRQDDERA